MIRKSVLRKSYTTKHLSQIDNHVCSLVIATQDLQKASKPLSRISSDEYLKALNDLKILRGTPTQSYTIDDKYMKDPDDTNKISFQQWLGRKSQLSKTSKKMEKTMKKRKAKEKKEAEDLKFKKLAQGEEIFKEWAKMKMIQHSSTEKLRLKNKNNEENLLKVKQKAARDKYKEWLMKSLKDLKKLKQIEQMEKQKKDNEKLKKQQETICKTEKAQNAYIDWLNKKKSFSRADTRIVNKSIKQRKVLMLAYSPNRKENLSLSSSEEISSKILSNPFKSETPRIKKLSKINTCRPPSEDSKTFDELSSIRKSPKVLNPGRFSDEPESFISTANHELD